MATMRTRTIHTVRHETYLASPTNWVETSKAQSAVKREIEAAGLNAEYDDIVTVEARGEEIVYYWEESTESL